MKKVPLTEMAGGGADARRLMVCMRRMDPVGRRPAAVAVICTVALAGAACGGSGHSQTVATAPPPRHGGAVTSTVANARTHPAPKPIATRGARTTSTTGAGSEMAAFTRTVLPASTPISSPAYHDAVVKAVVRAGRNAKTGEAIANCIQQILRNAGIETVGEADKLKQDPTGNRQVASGALQCLGSATP